MDKVKKQRDPKRQAVGRNGHEKYMAKLKEDILKNVGSSNGSSNTTNDSTNGGINTTNDSTTTTSSGSTITNFSYIHGIGAIVVLSLGVCIFIIPKLMRNPSQRDKDSLKNPKRSLKSDGKCYNKQDDNTTIRCKEKPIRRNKRRTSHYRSNNWNFLATKDGQNSFTSKGGLGCIRHHQTQRRCNNWSIAQRLCCL